MKTSTPGCLKGIVTVPGDKSISHRAVILNSLAHGKAILSGFLQGEDCLNSIKCLQQLGVQIQICDDLIEIDGVGLDGFQEAPDVLDVGNSGTTMRLLMGVLSGIPHTHVMTGDASIRRRPMGRVTRPLRMMGAIILGRDAGTLAPLTVSGGKLSPIHYKLPVASAQLKSALLIAGLFAEGKTEILEPIASRDHTERMLKAMGANLTRDGEKICLEGRPHLTAQSLCIPGDISSAAFWMVGALVTPGSELLIQNVGINPTRTGILEVLIKMGANIEFVDPREVGGEPVSDLRVRSSELKGTVISGDLIPRLIDEIPILALAAACAKGKTEIRDAGELRVKESDRIRAIATTLEALGAQVEELPDGLIIKGPTDWKTAQLDSLGDHRLAMTLGIAGLLSPVEILNSECSNTSYPGFWETLERLKA